jgi:hypothetical protein
MEEVEVGQQELLLLPLIQPSSSLWFRIYDYARRQEAAAREGSFETMSSHA